MSAKVGQISPFPFLFKPARLSPTSRTKPQRLTVSKLQTQLTVKTSSSKKRKISPQHSLKDDDLDSNSPDTPLQSCETDSDPNFSFTSASFAPSAGASPAYLRADSVPPASSLPPHLQTGTSASYAEYASSTASSPSGAYADLTISSDRGGDTPPGTESAQAAAASTHPNARGSSPFTGKTAHHRAIMGGAAEFPDRASSPLKRRASSMDPEVGADDSEDVDMIAAPTEATSDLPTVSDSDLTNDQNKAAAPISLNKAEGQIQGNGSHHNRVLSITMTEVPQPPESIEAHIKSIRTFCEELESRRLEDGEKVYIVSRKWVESVIGKELKKATMPDLASIGPVDNSDIIWEVIEDPCVGSSADPMKKFVRLKPGIGTEQFNLFPPTAWELVMQWPGLAPGQIPILRIAHKTSENELDGNINIEFHPPVFTIHRLWSANSPKPIKQIIKSSQPPPVRLARSRTTKYKTFLAQAKKETDIELKDKVRVWRVPHKLPATGPGPGAAPTPPASPSAVDPNNPQESWPNMLLDVESFLALELNVDRERVEFNDVTADQNYNGHVDIGKLGLSTDQTIVLDEQVEGTTYVSTYSPSAASEKASAVRSSSTSLAVSRNTRSGRTSPAPSGPLTRGRAQRSGRPIGCTGLGNLGNTCYMNAALQCVRSVDELTKYFLSGVWESEINKDNVLAHNGDVASAYAHLLKLIYLDSAPGSVTPRQFKNTIGRYAPAFSGYGQQDSQEFLGFLLDGLQEDLSRVKKKPYIEKPDSTDEMIGNEAAIVEMAEQVWDITKRRDDSVIADLFTGLYKSTLVCPDKTCAKVSITFDPFNNLTLPLPLENKWTHTIKFFPLNDKPVEIRVELDKSSSIKALKDFVSSRTGVPADRLHGAEEWKNKFYKQYADGAVASEEIGQTDNALVFELEAAPTNWNSAASAKVGVQNAMLVPVIHRRPAPSKTHTHYQRWQFALVPHFIVVNPEEALSEDAIRRKILQKVATFTKHPYFSRRDESDSVDSTDFATNGSDSSSNEGKVVAQSVQGEDDLVDVVMNGTSNADHGTQGAPTKQGPAKHVYNKTAPSWIDPGELLPPELQNVFDLSYFSEPGSLLPSGMNSVTEDREYPKLSSRVQEPTSSDDALDNLTNGTTSNEDASSDELSRRSIDMPATRMQDESEEEGSPVVKIPHRPKPGKQNAKSHAGRKTTKQQKKYGKKGTKQRNRQAAAASRKQQPQPQQIDMLGLETPPEIEDSGVDGGALIRLNEGIIVDWADGAYEQFFGDLNSSWDQCDTLDDPELDRLQQIRAKRRKHGVTLDDCLAEFEREEILSEQDTWYCPRCKQHQRASKKFDLWKTPDILIVHLKRFSSSGYRRDKLEVLVDFPIEGLDLTTRVLHKEEGKQEIYDLIGVDCHWGGLGGGHYTAHAKNFVDNQWYSYNDSSVSKANPDKIVDSSAYLLFYRRRSDVPLGGSRFKEIIDSFDNPTSDDDENSKTGEGQRLGEVSSPTGSPSAFQEHAAEATHLRHMGTNGSSDRDLANPGNVVDPMVNDGLPRLSNLTYDDKLAPVQRSIEEDEGIDMTESEPFQAGGILNQTWDFKMLPTNTTSSGGDAGVSGSPFASGAATDEAQHDSSGDEDIRSTRVDFELDADTEMDSIPGTSHYELGPAPEGDLPAYTEAPPPDFQGEISRDDLTRIWDEKQGVLNVPAEGEDQQSEEAAEIHIDEDDDKVKSE